MNIVLDQDLCIRCGRCMRACPMQIFARPLHGPVLVAERNLPRCIDCGQCAACCPKAAITLNGLNPLSLERVVDAPLTDVQRSMLFKARRSVRAYKPEPVPHEVLRAALEDARYAPTAGNCEQVEWILVEGSERLRALGARVADWARKISGRYGLIAAAFDAGGDPILRGAPALLLAHGFADNPFAPQDCSAAVSYLELTLHSRGIGSCWAGFVLAAAAQGTDLGLPLPQGRAFFAGLMVGYPDFRFERLPPRKEVRLTVCA